MEVDTAQLRIMTQEVLDDFSKWAMVTSEIEKLIAENARLKSQLHANNKEV